MKAKRTSKLIYYHRTGKNITLVVQTQTGKEIDGIYVFEADFDGASALDTAKSERFLKLKEQAEEKALYSFAHHPELKIVKAL